MTMKLPSWCTQLNVVSLKDSCPTRLEVMPVTIGMRTPIPSKMWTNCQWHVTAKKSGNKCRHCFQKQRWCRHHQVTTRYQVISQSHIQTLRVWCHRQLHQSLRQSHPFGVGVGLQKSDNRPPTEQTATACFEDTRSICRLQSHCLLIVCYCEINYLYLTCKYTNSLETLCTGWWFILNFFIVKIFC